MVTAQSSSKIPGTDHLNTRFRSQQKQLLKSSCWSEELSCPHWIMFEENENNLDRYVQRKGKSRRQRERWRDRGRGN